MTVIEPPNFSPKQKEFYKPVYDYMETKEGHSRLMILSGRRCGKSFALVNGYIPSFFKRRTALAYGAYTEKTTQGGWREITEYCGEMMRLFPGAGWRFAPAEDGVIKLPSGSTWDRLSFKIADAGRSMTFDGAHIDEVQLIPEETIANFLPTLSTTRGFAAFSGTIPKTWREWSESQWWLQIVMADEKEREEKWPDWKVIHYATMVEDLAWQIREDDSKNRREIHEWDFYLNAGQKEYNKMRSIMGKDRFKREVEVVITPPTSGMIWGMMTSSCIGDYGYDPSLGGEILIGMDRGWGSASSVILWAQRYMISKKDENGNVYEEPVYRIFKEFIHTGAISSQSLVIKAFQESPNPNITLYPDPRAKDLHYEIDALGLPNFRNSCPIFEGNELVNTRFEQGRIEINRDCNTLIRQAQRYSLTEKDEPSDVDNDTCDALRYLIYQDNIYSGNSQVESSRMVEMINNSGGHSGFGYLPV